MVWAFTFLLEKNLYAVTVAAKVLNEALILDWGDFAKLSMSIDDLLSKRVSPKETPSCSSVCCVMEGLRARESLWYA